MSNIDKQALRDIAEKTKIAGEAPVMPFEQRINALNDFMKHFTPATALALLDELEASEHTAAVDHEAACSLVEENEEVKRKLVAAEKRIAELQSSHSKLRDTLATIHNTIRLDGGYTPLAAILNAARCAYEESATAAGIGKGE